MFLFSHGFQHLFFWWTSNKPLVNYILNFERRDIFDIWTEYLFTIYIRSTNLIRNSFFLLSVYGKWKRSNVRILLNLIQMHGKCCSSASNWKDNSCLSGKIVILLDHSTFNEWNVDFFNAQRNSFRFAVFISKTIFTLSISFSLSLSVLSWIRCVVVIVCSRAWLLIQI